ncbi:hypothetical protein F5Y09DRAFT_301346 [Xylaria sp. FL1042]|nr:hypothetical protein F5Y09DRAFT_301346 [Xylaria sp. FL1042]
MHLRLWGGRSSRLLHLTACRVLVELVVSGMERRPVRGNVILIGAGVIGFQAEIKQRTDLARRCMIEQISFVLCHPGWMRQRHYVTSRL